MVFLYDGSFEGLLTCIFEAFSSRQRDVSIFPKYNYQPSFLEQAQFVETDTEKYQRVYSSIPEKISDYALKVIYRAWLSEDNDAGSLICHFLRAGYKMGDKVTDYIQDPKINAIMDLNRKVGFEAHRFLGLLRFKEITEGIFYAVYEPDHNITILIAPHFMERLSSQPFIIHDRKRNLCAVYDGQEMVMTDKIPELPSEVTGNEDEYASLWKAFFKTIAIKERKNLRTQLNFMPARYWKNLTEMQDY